MIVLDTDHLSQFQRGQSAAAHQLKSRLLAANDEVATTIVCIEE
jgi:predicted nucleic acid-binding protein